MVIGQLKEFFEGVRSGSKKIGSGDKYGSFLCEVEKYCGPLKGKTVLEIGSDWNGTLLGELKGNLKVDKAYGINLKSRDSMISENVYHLKRDAGNTGFDDCQFDNILSLATFEHIEDLSSVLCESYRVLKKGGTLFTLFGPIWPSAWGHHLWVTVDNVTYNYHNTKLPPFCHLISNKDDIISFLEKEYGYPVHHCEVIAEYACSSQEQNKLFFEDYERIFAESEFKVLLLAGHKNIPYSDYPHLDNYTEFLNLVAARYPHSAGKFGYNAISVLLCK